jgi:hypothetical protein
VVEDVVVFLVAEIRQDAHGLDLLLNVLQVLESAFVAADFALGIGNLNLVPESGRSEDHSLIQNFDEFRVKDNLIVR